MTFLFKVADNGSLHRCTAGYNNISLQLNQFSKIKINVSCMTVEKKKKQMKKDHYVDNETET